MPLPAWPNTLPRLTRQSGWSRTQRFRPAVSEFDDGPVGARRWSRIKATREAMSWQMSEAQVAIFEAFFNDELNDGTLRFSMVIDWGGIVNETRTCHFEGNRPEITNQGGGWYIVSGQVTVYG